MNRFLKKISPGRLIALGFAAVILLGTVLFLLPVSHVPGADMSFTDALFTATSAVCVTGLLTIDPGSTLSYFGQAVLLMLIALLAEAFEWKKMIFIICFCVVASQTAVTVFGDVDPEHNRLHRHSSRRILETLNDEKINPRSVLMPYSAWKLVDAFRGKLRGWEFGGIPIKYPKD